jgi:hypothetical protein
MNNPWTSIQRNEFIKIAKTSDKRHGYKGPYHYSAFPKNDGGKEMDISDRKHALAQTLANVIFKSDPKFRVISLNLYALIIDKIRYHPCLSYYYMHNDIIVMIKGSNAYALLFENDKDESDEWTFSDLDIVIYINPNLCKDIFDQIKYDLHILALQSISQYKRTLDHMFFINKPLNDAFLNQQDIDEFKERFTKALQDIGEVDGGTLASPFVDEETRNKCSRNSVMIVNNVNPELVVRVDVPHYDKCERIPLRKTPLFASYNETIAFSRCKNNVDIIDGHFDLYRLRFNCLFQLNNQIIEEDEDGRYEKITADFIDVSIASQDDIELIDFWNRGKSLCILEKSSNIWLDMPDIETCLHDLFKMLNIYDCPEQKKQKRLCTYSKIKELSESH